jgi:hypothetical protein
MKGRADNFITVVSGLPRSGTSMMMKMLDAGKMPLLTDELRKADLDNPKGYYEYEKVKKLEDDNSWLDIAQGKTVKIVSPLLHHLKLDAGYAYKIIFMIRDLDETLASQKKMSERLNNHEDTIKDNILKNEYNSHLEEIEKWLEQQENIEVLPVQYKDVLENPLAAAEGIHDYLGIELDVNDMAAIVDPSLYRQRTEELFKPAQEISVDAETDEKLIIERLKNLSYM